MQGRDLNIVTDHQPLVKAFRSTNDNFTPRQTRHLSYIAEFTGNLEFINGFLNIASDALSRTEINAVSLISEVLPLTEIAARQQDAEFEASLSSSNYQSLLLEKRFLLASQTSIIGDTSKGTFSVVVVPTSLTKRVFDTMRSLSHPGIKGTQRMIGDRFVWHGMKRDITEWCRTCIKCQKCKFFRHNRAPLDDFIEPCARFCDVYIDLVESLPLSNGCSYLLTEVESRTQGSRPRPRTQKKIQGQGQPFRGQTLSRPRTGMLEAKAKDQGHKRKCSPKKKKKGLHKNFSGDLQKKKKKRSSQKFFKRSPQKNVF